jgi:hypothetical protein
MAKATKKFMPMTLPQQLRAVTFLKDIVLEADEQNPGQCGFDDDAGNHKMRMFLIEVGAMPDRREK